MEETMSLTALSAVELRPRIGTKAISPVELLEACIARIEALNPAVNAIAGRAFGRARAEAKDAEAAVLAGETDRKSTRRTPVTNAHIVCRLLLEKQNNQHVQH